MCDTAATRHGVLPPLGALAWGAALDEPSFPWQVQGQGGDVTSAITEAVKSIIQFRRTVLI